MWRIITPLIAGLALLALLLSLGFWQLDRAEEKRELAARYASGESADEAALIRTPAALEAAGDYEAVMAHGRFVSGRQVLLDAQTHAGRAGYRVWTPFELDGGGWIIVDRGWVPASGDRRELPDVTVDERQRTVRGQRAPLPRPGLRVGEPDTGDGTWPRRLVWPDAAALAAVWGRPVPDALLLLGPEQADGFVREWNPVGMPPERHVGYAVQWFALAAALVVIVLVLTFRRRRDG